MFAHIGDAAEHHLFDEIVSGSEVVVDGGRLNLGVLGDVRESRSRIPFDAQDVRGGVEDARPGACGFRVRFFGSRTVRRTRFSSHRSMIWPLNGFPWIPTLIGSREPPAKASHCRGGLFVTGLVTCSDCRARCCRLLIPI